MESKYRICIADDHSIVRDGLRLMLESDSHIDILCEATDGLDLIKKVKTHMPDLILLDISMPKLNGLESMREIKNRHPTIKFLILTMHIAEEYIFSALKDGANGYVLKTASRAELMLAIESVLSGEFFVSPAISDKIIKGYVSGVDSTATTRATDRLTHREREMLKLVAEGYKNREISSYLNISIKTVENHRNNLMKKLDLHNSSALTFFAIQNGLVNC